MQTDRSFHSVRPAAWSACVLLLASFSPAFGQPRAPAANEAPAVKLEEFTVTGDRPVSFKTERVQMGAFRDVDPVDIPISINVITREALDAQAARGLLDAMQNTAGVTRAQLSGSTYDNIGLRGIPMENRSSYRLNGSLPIINLVDHSMENKERVEVLKGSGGLYYGFVPPSGIVNLVTKRPAAKPVTSLTLSGNSHGAYGGHLDVSRRFGSRASVGLRLNLASSKEDIGLENFGGHREFGSLAADWRATDKLLLRFDVEHISKNVTEQPTLALPAAVAGVITLPRLPANHRNYGGSWQHYEAQATNTLVRADYLISRSWTVLVEAGQAMALRDRRLGGLTINNLVTGASTLRVTFAPDTLYQNKNIRGEVFGRILTGEIRHDLTIGATTNQRFQDNGAAGNLNIAQNFYNPVPVAEVKAPAVTTHTPTTIHDGGFYAFDRIALLKERVQITAGARHTSYSSTSIVAGAVQRYKKSGEIYPIASALFKPTAKSSVYASYLEGPEPGGVAGTTLANAGQILNPLVSEQWELGAKAELFGGALFQVAGFQIERPGTFIDATNRLVPNGLSRYKGVEAFVSGEIVKSVSLIASGLAISAKNTNAANAATINRTPEATPRRTGSLAIEWRTPFAAGLAISGGAYYTGRQPVNNTNQGYLGGFTMLTAGISHRFKVGALNYTARVNVTNLTDKNTWSTAGNNLLGVSFPRTVKFALTTSY